MTNGEEKFVLIVDDSDDDYDIMKVAMEASNGSATAHRRCKSGQEALDYLLRRGPYAEPAASPTPSLVLLDLNMPGLDGRETLRIIKSTAELRNIPVVVMTNSENEDDVAACYANGANSYVRKSLDFKGFVKVIATTLAFWMGAALAPSTAEASYGPSTVSIETSAVYSAVVEGEEVQPPRGFVEMCERRAELCAAQRIGSDLDQYQSAMAARFGAESLTLDVPVLTDQRLRMLEQVNATVNSTMAPRSDPGADHWELGALSGDCEDYVLTKREMLARLGYPRSAMRVTVVHTGVEYHAVLVVSTRQGDFILDNMNNYIMRIEDSAYELVVAESLSRPGRWVRISRG